MKFKYIITSEGLSYKCYNSSYEKFVEQLNKELNNGINITKCGNMGTK